MLETEITMTKYSGGNLDNLMNEKGYTKIENSVYENETTGEIVIVDEDGKVTIASGETIVAKVAKGDIAKGDYVAYNPAGTSATYTIGNTYSGYNIGTEQTVTRSSAINNLNWRILDIKDGQVRLISDVPTTDTIALRNAAGYNNAVKILDDLCIELYNNTDFAAKVQSLKIEDIQKYLNITDYSSFHDSYGKTDIKPSTNSYPNIFAKENKQLGNPATGKLGFSEQDKWYEGTSTATPLDNTYTYWGYSFIPENVETDWKDTVYRELFISPTNDTSPYPTYWMSSRCSYADATNARYYIRRVDSGNVSAAYVYNSSGTPQTFAFGVRPVVTLKANIQVGGKIGDVWNLN